MILRRIGAFFVVFSLNKLANRVVSLAIIAMFLLIGVMNSLPVSASDLDDIFTFTDKGTYYQVKPKDRTLASYNVPSTYNGKPVDLYLMYYRTNSITEAVVPDVAQTDDWLVNHNPYRVVIYSTSVKTVKVDYKGHLRLDLMGCSVVEDVYLYCTSLTLNASSFRNNNLNCKFHVINDDVKTALINAGIAEANIILESGNIPENPLDYTNLDKALADGEAVDTSNYTEATVTALTDAIAAGKAVKENTSATQTDIDNAAKAITDAIAGLVVKLDYTAMDAAIAEAEDIIANHSGEYTEESIADLKFGLDTAKAYRGRDTNQDTIDEVTRVYLTLKIKNLVKIDIAAMLGDLKAVIEDAEAIDESEYTEESYQVLADAITAAKAMNEDTNYKDILAAQSSIKNAVSKLVLKPLEEFVRVYKGGAVAEITSGKADASMAGATSVRITFNCASDVSYNQYSSIEVKAIVSGTESYEKFIGKGDYTTGTNGWTETLTLTNAIAEGQSYEVTAFTYAWANASDYVYAVSKVEFLDAEGNVVAKVTANTQALSELKQAIEEAEKVDTDLYTEDTVKVLLDKIGVAKIITEKSTVAEIKAATEAITKAIEDLELKVRYGNISGTINVSDGDESTEMTVTVTAQDGTETSVTAKSMGSYSIENIEEGEYTITISGGKYAPRSYEVVVSEGSITQDADLNPYGDINGDGKVTTADVGMANSHAKGVTELTGYKYTCANVNTGDEITTADVGMINSHAKSVDTLW